MNSKKSLKDLNLLDRFLFAEAMEDQRGSEREVYAGMGRTRIRQKGSVGRGD